MSLGDSLSALFIPDRPFVLSVEETVYPVSTCVQGAIPLPLQWKGCVLIMCVIPWMCSCLLSGRQLPRKAHSSVEVLFPDHGVSHLGCLSLWLLGCITPTDFQVGFWALSATGVNLDPVSPLLKQCWGPYTSQICYFSLGNDLFPS